MGFGPRSKRPCLFTTYSTAGIGDNYPGLIRCGLHPVCAEHFSLNSYLLVAALSDAVSWFPPPSASIRISLMSPGSSLIASPGSVRTISTPVRIVLQYVLFQASFRKPRYSRNYCGGRRPSIAGKDLPPLPDIKKEEIRLQVFTHRSFYARQTRLFEDHPGRNGCYVNAPIKTSRLSDNA